MRAELLVWLSSEIHIPRWEETFERGVDFRAVEVSIESQEIRFAAWLHAMMGLDRWLRETSARKTPLQESIEARDLEDGAQTEVVPASDVADVPPEMALAVRAAGVAGIVLRHKTNFGVGGSKVGGYGAGGFIFAQEIEVCVEGDGIGGLRCGGVGGWWRNEGRGAGLEGGDVGCLRWARRFSTGDVLRVTAIGGVAEVASCGVC